MGPFKFTLAKQSENARDFTTHPRSKYSMTGGEWCILRGHINAGRACFTCVVSTVSQMSLTKTEHMAAFLSSHPCDSFPPCHTFLISYSCSLHSLLKESFCTLVPFFFLIQTKTNSTIFPAPNEQALCRGLSLRESLALDSPSGNTAVCLPGSWRALPLGASDWPTILGILCHLGKRS